MTERLQKCIDAGSLMGAARVMSDWPESELRALLEDIETYHGDVEQRINSAFKDVAFKAENFMNADRAKLLDRAVNEARNDNFIMCAEIASVACLYLGDSAEQREGGNGK